MKPPLTGLAAATQALRFYEKRHEVTANNLANADTVGFKAERVFAQLVSAAGESLPAPVPSAATDRSLGALRATERPLDVAMDRDGFFVVQTPQGEQLTRGGSLRLDAERRLVDATGAPMLGERGPIVCPPGSVPDIAADGTVSVGGTRLDVLRIEGVAPGETLVHAGATHFVPPATRTLLPAAERGVRQGQLEDANVNAVEGLVEMIDTQRNYATVERAVRVLDEVRETAATQIGRS